jgi:erythronate-4-phosphate dehydrogenase
MKIVADGNIPFVSKCFSSIGEVKVVEGRQITPAAVRDADILLVRSITPVNEKLLAGSKVKFVATATIGFEHVDVDYLKSRNISFASAPGSNANSVAEYIVAALLSVGTKHKITLEGKSIGIVGVGNVGSNVAKKCLALGMRVKLNDPPLSRQTGDPKYQLLQELFGCDFITLHTPLTFEGGDKTFHLADEKFFASLKLGCVFINTSRGGVVDIKALKAAIHSGRLRAVVLDVWENEPNIDTELLRIVDIGTPHIAGYSLDGKVSGMIMIYKAACEYFGLEAEYTIEDFLPEPTIRVLKIESERGTEQDVVAGAVQRIYDIRKDDARLRWILERPAEKRGEFFDGLRKNYPVRREFGNTTVVIATENTEFTEDKLASKKLLNKLSGIGFKVGNAKS